VEAPPTIKTCKPLFHVELFSMRSSVSLAGPAIILLLVAGAAGAQTAPPSAREACRSSALSLCRSEALARDRAAVRACLIRNFDKVAPECQAAMKAAQARGMDAKPDAPPPKP
jgi:hypothetical protein